MPATEKPATAATPVKKSVKNPVKKTAVKKPVASPRRRPIASATKPSSTAPAAPKATAARAVASESVGDMKITYAQPKPLTKAQIDYARQRLAVIAAKLIEARTAKLAPVGEAPQLSFDQKYDLIARGRAKLRPRVELTRHSDLEDAYTYPTHEREAAKHKSVATARDNAVQRITADVEGQARAIADRLVLSGDGAAALAALEEFGRLK